jgi:hypothetical protein
MSRAKGKNLYKHSDWQIVALETPQEKEMLSRQIESTDGAIDGLVYALPPSGMIYGLSPNEIKIVEG